MQIARLDPRDDAAMRAWHDTYSASHHHGRAHAVPLQLEEVRAKLLAERSTEADLAFAGLADGVVATVGYLHLSLEDNTDRAFLEVQTRPGSRGRGHGTAMLGHLEQVAGDHGRSVLVTEIAYPYDAPADGAGTGPVRFAERRGYRFALAEVQRALSLPVDESLLDALTAEAASHHDGYTFVQFEGAVPDEVVESFARIIGTLVTEAPSGDLDHKDEAFDVARIRADEEVFAASGRRKFTTVALDPAGEVAAYSELVLPRHDPRHAFQWGTLARRQDRGHRLGLATKARNLRFAQPYLGRRTLVTYNAEVNAHMVGVNERLGFRPVERLGQFQKRR